MSSYSNFYNSSRYGNNNSNEENSGNNFAGNRQPVQPPNGYMEASYNWNNHGATPGLENQQIQNPKAYSDNNNNDVYSRSQGNSSSFAHLPTALGGYGQGAQTGENTQRSTTGLNSLVYASSLESAYPKSPGTSHSAKLSSQSAGSPSQYPNTTASYTYPSQSSAANQAANSRTTVNYNQQPQRSFPSTSQTTAPSYTSTSYDTARQYQTQPTHLSQPERRPSPKVKPQAKAPRRASNYKSPPITQASTNTSLNATSYSQPSHQYSSHAANTSSVASQHPVASQESTAASVSRTQTPPTMAAQNHTREVHNNATNVASSSGMEPRASDQTSPSKVQYINPSDLFTQQYFLAQERARAAEAEAVAKENRRKEAEVGAQAVAAEATAAAENTPSKGKATNPKPAKNSAKKRSSAKKKAADKDPIMAAGLEPEDDMADEMRSMLEKLRGMRSKDPSLFSKLWDDFKKAPGSNQATSTPPAPSSGPAAATSKQPLVGPPATVRTPGTGKGTTDGSLPDLGKFPAQRRRRNRKSDTSQVPSKSQPDIPAITAQVNVDSMLNQQPQSLPPPTAFDAQRATSDNAPNSTVAQAKQSKASDATKQSQPKTNPGQNATWPAATQQRLAQAASEYLRKGSANNGKECSADSLMLLLRNNPTYPDLCSQLESRGFVLDRQAMARFLLAAVPTLLSSNNGQESKKAEATSNAPASQLAQSLPQPNPVTDPSPLPQPVSSSNAVPQTQAPASRPHAPPQLIELDLNTGVTTTVPLPAQRQEKNKSLQRPRKSGGQFASIPVIGPKAEQSRKRLFSEIVDMTQVSSDEDEDMLSDDGDSYPGHGNNSRFGSTAGGQPGFSGLGQDAMDLDTDSPQLTDHDLSAKEAEMGQPDIDIEFDPDDEFVLESIKKLPNIVKPMKPSAALHRVYYNPKSIARDIMLATGRHPTDRPLNYHLMRLTQTFTGVSTKSDFETFRWDVVDPGGPSMPVVEPEDILVEPPQITRKRRHRLDQPRDAADGSGPTSDGQAAPGVALPAVSTPQAVRDSAMAAATPTSGQRTGRRGRPPGAKNKKPTKAALKAAGATVASSSSTKNVRIAGSESEPTPTVPDPSYPVFTCEWASCPAQLHDVHTLERHVSKVHLPGQKTCQWQSCPNSTTEYSDEALKEHLAKAHIQPLAWKYGDGPSVNGTDFEIDRYLNSKGMTVTPDAATAGESDALIFPVEQTPIRAFNKLYGDQKPTQRAQQVLRAIQKRRKHVGIGLEQEGCEFSNPVRNKLFVNDEEWYEVVPDEEDGVDNWFAQEDVS